MENFRVVCRSGAVFFAAMLVLAADSGLQAQTAASQAQDSQPLQASEIPAVGTFWVAASNAPPIPAPFDPYPWLNVYLLGDGSGQYLIDGSAFDYTTLEQQAEANAALTSAAGGMDGAAMLPATPDDGGSSGGGDGGSGISPMGSQFTASSNLLYLTIDAVSNGVAYITLWNTVHDTVYEVLSSLSLSNASTGISWNSEGTVLGIDGSTPATIAVGTRTNSLYIWARSYTDQNGSGIPTWWLQKYFGGSWASVDPYSILNGDGWTVLQAYQNGWNPLQVHTPPVPTGLAAQYSAGTSNVSVTWNPSPGPVTSYTLARYIPQLNQTNYYSLSASVTSFSDSPFPLSSLSPGAAPPSYQLLARYAVADSPWSDRTAIYRLVLDDSDSENWALDWSGAYFVRGPAGRPYLAVSAIPLNTTNVQLVGSPSPMASNTVIWMVRNLPISSFTNGVCLLPGDFLAAAGDLTTNGWFARTVDAKGVTTSMASVAPLWYSSIPYFDGREQMRDNLSFLLRTADLGYGTMQVSLGDPGYPQTDVSCPWDYVYSSFYHFDADGLGIFTQDEFGPFVCNNIYRNFVFTPSDVYGSSAGNLAGDLATGLYDWGGPYSIIHPNPKYAFQAPATVTNIPSLLAPAQTPWTCRYPDWSGNLYLGAPGCDYFIPTDLTNIYGLIYRSAKLCWGSNATESFTLQAGQCSTSHDAAVYWEITPPVLQTTGYYFTAVGFDFHNTGSTLSLLPGMGGFSVTNATPLLFTGIGSPLKLAGYAKQVVLNGDHTIPAYLGQYFDKAYLANPDGTRSTNETGIVSEYGDFFPTDVGPVILTTKPDLSQTNNLQGECKINVIKLQLDVNHDGVMDLSFGGPDNTSAASPFVFWVNNDHNEPASGSNPDQDVSDWGNPPPVPPDYTYGAIRCQRNLEDFARLWICGMPALPAAYSVQLGWSTISSGSPTMRLYWASETNGGIGYLTNTAVAAQQIAQHNTPIGEISPNSTLVLPANSFSNGLPRYFLFEAGAVGSGQLTLTISQGGTNTIAQTSAWLDLHDITDLYEQALVTNVLQYWPGMVLDLPTSGFRTLYSPPSRPSEAKQTAAFVHGWRLTQWEAWNFAQTMFKRLYWQGFQGRFASIRWPTRSADTDPVLGLDFTTYNRSEHIAFKSGTGVAAWLMGLRARFPDYTNSVCAHSMGNIVMMEALKELAAAGQAPIDNYVLMQAAVPAQCYDTAATNFQPFMNLEGNVPTPNAYHNYAAGITNALRAGGKLVNFFNPGDFALSAWEANEGFYQNTSQGLTTMKPLTFFGYYTDGTNSILRTNYWNQTFPYNLMFGYNGPTRAITDPHEVMPFVARPRTKTVGNQAGVHGQIQGEVNLQDQFGFGETSSDHSGEWNRNIQEPQVALFYPALLDSMFRRQQ